MVVGGIFAAESCVRSERVGQRNVTESLPLPMTWIGVVCACWWEESNLRLELELSEKCKISKFPSIK